MLDGPPLPSFKPFHHHNNLPTDPAIYAALQKSCAESTDIGALGGAKGGGENEDENEEEVEGVKFMATSTPTLPEHLLPSAAGARTRNLLGGLTASAHLLKNEVSDDTCKKKLTK